MTDIPTRRARLGLTGGRLALVAILVLGSAGGAAAYAMRQPAPQASAGSAPSTSGPPSTAASAVPVVPSAVPRSAASAAPKPSAPTTTTTKAPEQQSTHAQDSAVDPDAVFADPASTVASAPQPDLSTPPTCGQWRRIFSDKQQISYAKAALRAAWKSEGAAGIPPERTARSFRSAITAACLGKGKADDNVPDVARVVYAADPDRWGP